MAHLMEHLEAIPARYRSDVCLIGIPCTDSLVRRDRSAVGGAAWLRH